MAHNVEIPFYLSFRCNEIVRFFGPPIEGGQGFEGLGDFLDHVEAGIRALVREMLQAYAEDEFMRYIGARPYERTKNRRDYRNGTRRKTLRTRFRLIEDLQIPLASKVGVGYSSVVSGIAEKTAR